MNKTIVFDPYGKSLFYDVHSFVSEIIEKECCFICGVDKDATEFNNEHIIPEWILRKFDLFNRNITLPNGKTVSYRNYLLPCCKSCNELLGKEFEHPISILFSKEYNEIVDLLQNKPGYYKKIFLWLTLIYLKTHLKDKFYKANLDKRVESENIGDWYVWEEMHHLHCLVRSVYTGAIISNDVYGSLFILPIVPLNDHSFFDYMDTVLGKVVMIQLGFVALIAVLNDSCAVNSFLNQTISKIKGPITQFQLKELFCHANFINSNLVHRPKYISEFNFNGEYEINVQKPEKLEIDMEQYDKVKVKVGEMLYHYLQKVFPPSENREQYLEEIKAGNRAFLFDSNGEFLQAKW